MDTHPCDCCGGTYGCLKEKLRYWREEKPLTTKIPKGWGGPSVYAQAKEVRETAEKEGRDIEPVGNRWV